MNIRLKYLTSLVRFLHASIEELNNLGYKHLLLVLLRSVELVFEVRTLMDVFEVQHQVVVLGLLALLLE